MTTANGEKLVLAVAAGKPLGPIADVIGNNKLGDMRPIIRDGLVPALTHLSTGKRSNYSFVLDYVQAPGEKALAAGIQKAKDNSRSPQGYDVVFTIASSATAAAQDAFGSDENSTPIVFVVVSDPKGEGFVTNLNKPEGNTTGFSTNLRDDAAAALRQFLDWAQTINGTVLVMHQPFFPPAHPIVQKLRRVAQQHHPNAAFLDRKFVETPDDVLDTVNRMVGGKTNGLFLMPDDLVLSQAFGGTLLSVANGKKVPTFCQQVELVDKNPRDWQDNALGAMGIPGVEIGKAAATYIDKLLRGGKVSDLPVIKPPDRSFPALIPVCKWNPVVAENLDLPQHVAPCVLPREYQKARKPGAERGSSEAPSKTARGSRSRRAIRGKAGRA